VAQVRTRLTGDTELGRHFGHAQGDCILGQAPMTFIYGEPKEDRPVELVGAYCTGSVGDTVVPVPFQLIEVPLSRGSGYISRAPLTHIRSALVFSRSNGLCAGILLRYENGGVRAVGQCRIHVDASESFTNPSRFCFRFCTRVSGYKAGVRVEFGADGPDSPHLHEGGAWQCFPLRGTLEFTFTPSWSRIAMIEDGV